MDLNKRKGPPRFRRVRATGSRRPGYIWGIGAVQSRLLEVLRGVHQKFFGDLLERLAREPRQAVHRLIQTVRQVGVEWESRIIEEAMPQIQSLYTTGLKHGGVETGLGFDPKAADPNALRYLMSEPHGIVPALQNFVEEERAFAEQIIRQSFEEGTFFDRDIVRNQLAERMQGERWRLNRIVRTETNKIAGMGRLHSWEADPRRGWYDYHYIATHDHRTRHQHMEFMREGPYSFDRIKQIWIEDREPFNCRCTLTRTLKPKAVLLREGLATAEEIEDLF